MTEIVDIDMPENAGEQISDWLAGKPWHNHLRNECCPDFSCCKPELLAPLHERKAFCRLDEDGRLAMLQVFLERALNLAASESGKDAETCVIGIEPKGSA